MRTKSLCFGTLTAIGLAFSAHAADVDAKGAADLVKTLTAFLPEKAVSTGFIEAVPDGDHYILKVDIGHLVRAFVPTREFDLDLSFDGFISPPKEPEGLMGVMRKASDLNFAMRWDKGPEKGSTAYLIRDFVLDGEFDPSVYYFRSATAHASGGSMKVDDGKQKLEASFGPFDQTISSARNGDGSVDIGARAMLAGLRETIMGPGVPPFTFGMDTLAIDVTMKQLKMVEFVDILRFVAAHASDTTLKVEDRKQLAGLARKALPFLGPLDETLTAEGLTAEGQGVKVRIGKAVYKIGMDGLGDNSAFRFGLSLSGPEVTGIPQVAMYGDLVPKDIALSLSIPDLNFASAANAFFDQADFAKPEPLTKEQSEAIGRLFLKDRRLKVAVPEFSARSPLYDISVTGSMSVDVDAEPARTDAAFDVTARDLDTTIKAIQQLGQKVPDLNTASFVMMMAKGIAKTDPDGTSHWKVEIAENGEVKVNGQVMPH